MEEDGKENIKDLKGKGYNLCYFNFFYLRICYS